MFTFGGSAAAAVAKSLDNFESMRFFRKGFEFVPFLVFKKKDERQSLFLAALTRSSKAKAIYVGVLGCYL